MSTRHQEAPKTGLRRALFLHPVARFGGGGPCSAAAFEANALLRPMQGRQQHMIPGAWLQVNIYLV
jgi:hypothetical protein